MGSKKYYSIKSAKNEYRCMVQSRDFSYTLLFGGTKRCIVVTIHIDDGIAHIDAAGWHSYCNKDGNMPRASGGTIDMLQSCIAFIFRKFPFIQKITLVDDSSIQCSKHVNIKLAPHYILKHGCTWYERYFGAELEDLTEQRKYRTFLANLQKQPKPFSFQTFASEYIKKAHLGPKKAEGITAAVEPLYTASKSIEEFLKKCDAEFECAIFEGWLYKFMISYSGIRLWDVYWSIERKNLKHKPTGISISIAKDTNASYDWEQFGGIPSHILLRNGVSS